MPDPLAVLGALSASEPDALSALAIAAGGEPIEPPDDGLVALVWVADREQLTELEHLLTAVAPILASANVNARKLLLAIEASRSRRPR